MRLFMFFVLASYAVRCDDNYYVIEVPEEPTKRADSRRPFKVYWNVPTMQCTSKKIPFTNLDRFGIIQNTGDSFRGDKIAILYDPGLFPALLKNETSGKYKFRNGGVPQEGSLERHVQAFRDIMATSVPDPDFNGVGIIDFESWRPVFRQNFGVLVPYKDVSLEIERKLHWWWPKEWMQAEAKRRFEEAARTFMKTTLSIAKQMRPLAVWGYYGFPYCFNMANKDMIESCSDTVKRENDGLYWLWSESTAVYPSVYSSRSLSGAQLSSLVRGRVSEAARVRGRGARALPYYWFRYREGGFMSQNDLDMVLKTFYTSGADGFIIWGSSKDVNTAEKCTQLRNYVETVLGPAIAKYASNVCRTENDVFYEEHDYNNTNTHNNDDDKNKTQIEPDPEFHWVPPENYTQSIEQHVKELIKTNRYNTTDENKTTQSPDRNSLLDIVLHLIMNEKQNITEVFEAYNENNVTKNDERDGTTEQYLTTDVYNITTNQYIESTTETLSTRSTITEESDLDTIASSIDPTNYTTIESTTPTESTTFKTSTERVTTTELTSTTDSQVTESTQDKSKAILDVNMTEFLLVDKNVSKNEKKGFPLKESLERTTEIISTDETTEINTEFNTPRAKNDILPSSNGEADDSLKNNKKGLPKSTNLEEKTTSDAPFVHQVDF